MKVIDVQVLNLDINYVLCNPMVQLIYINICCDNEFLKEIKAKIIT